MRLGVWYVCMYEWALPLLIFRGSRIPLIMQAGVISEILEDTMEAAMPDDSEEVDEVIDQVLWEVTNGSMGKAPPVTASSLAAGRADSVSEGPAAAGAARAPARVAVGADGTLMASGGGGGGASLRDDLGRL